jgi:lipid II:glycine glycyltransferase (peptidoglycan interpeptide bridge formation enzyme)
MPVLSSADEGFPAQARWDEFVQRAPSGHLLQSWAWGEFKAGFGWQAPLRLALFDGERIVAGAQILFRPLPLPWLTIAYVPKGPIVERSDFDAAGALLSAMHDACRRRHALALKIEPDWEDTPLSREWLEGRGFAPSARTVQPRRSVVIDLRLDEEAILAQMKPKTRYNVRLASRKGVSVRLAGADDLPVFYRLLQTTGRRDGFGIHSLAYYSQAWRVFTEQRSAALFLAEYGGQVLAGIMVFAWADKALYMYGASSDEERQRMPNHLLQWEAMRWAKGQGCETYDLWGIPDVDESAVGSDVAEAEESGVLSQGLGGLYRFKRGFGGREVRYVGAYDWVYSRPLHRLLNWAWSWRSR